VPFWGTVLLLKIQRKGRDILSLKSPVVDQERMRQMGGFLWLLSVLWVLLSDLTPLVGLFKERKQVLVCMSNLSTEAACFKLIFTKFA